MAEIEHFVDPKDKSCAKFARYADMKVLLFSARDQEEGKAASWQKLGDALKAGTIDNETLAYYMARTHLYLTMVGVDVERLRFRQHLANEMAHYAQASCKALHKNSCFRRIFRIVGTQNV